MKEVVTKCKKGIKKSRKRIQHKKKKKKKKKKKRKRDLEIPQLNHPAFVSIYILRGEEGGR